MAQFRARTALKWLGRNPNALCTRHDHAFVWPLLLTSRTVMHFKNMKENIDILPAFPEILILVVSRTFSLLLLDLPNLIVSSQICLVIVHIFRFVVGKIFGNRSCFLIMKNIIVYQRYVMEEQLKWKNNWSRKTFFFSALITKLNSLIKLKLYFSVQKNKILKTWK